MKKDLHVVGAVIIDNGKIIALKWEFPGGKIEQEKTHQNALESYSKYISHLITIFCSDTRTNEQILLTT